MATIQLPLDFKEFLQYLNEERVDYLVVGGYAVNVHGYVRATGDLDVWIGIAPTNIDSLVRALRRFGFGQIDAAVFQNRSAVFQIGVVPLRIDIFTSIPGLDFDAALSRRVQVELAEIQVAFLCRDDLLASKLASGRSKDLADIDNLP